MLLPRSMPSQMSPEPKFRSPTFYRIVLALPIIAILFLVATGRFQQYWAAFSIKTPPSDAAFQSSFLTAVIWLAAITPLVLAAWEAGVKHTAARRFGTALFVGLRIVVRTAFGRRPAISPAELARPPQDNRATALLLGLAIALGLPAFFLWFVPDLRTTLGVLWLVGAGVLMGLSAYSQRRAAAYITDEPGTWDLVRQYRLFNPARYSPSGRVFVRLQIFAIVALMMWWLVGGFFIITRQQHN